MKIGIIHPDLKSPGGADAVCVNTIEALKDDHEIDLITVREPDFTYLNDFFGADAEVDRVRVPSSSRLVNRSGDYTQRFLNIGLDRMKKAILNRYAQRNEGDFDLIISTKNEISVEKVPTVQYFHVPQYTGGTIPGVVGNQHLLLPIYYRVCKYVGGFDLQFDDTDQILSNSEWTAQMVEKAYGVKAQVVYPPINPPETVRPFEERENGFLCIGRIVPSKNIHDVIDIIGGVVERGHNVHLHIIGPTSSTQYESEIRDRAEVHEWLYFDGELAKTEFDEAISSHKFGIHGREFEHFGISIAEMAMSGVIPFVPDSGGQTETVDRRNELIFHDKTSAIDKITDVVTYSDIQKPLSRELKESGSRFGQEKFKTEIRSVVESVTK